MEEKEVQEKRKKQKKPRIWEIDFLRGVCIILMVVDHLFYDLAQTRSVVFSLSTNYRYISSATLTSIRNFAIAYWTCVPRVVAHYFVAGLFFVLSGISCALSKNNWLHGTKILIGSALFQGLGWILYFVAYNNGRPGSVVPLFNVLLALSLGVFVCALLRLLKFKGHGWFMLGLGAVIVILGWSFNLYSIELLVEDNQKWFYTFFTWEDIPSLLLGLKCWGSDYYPILPCLGYSILGCGIGELVYEKKKASLLPSWDKGWHRPVSFVGRHTMWVYLLHQVVLIGGIAIFVLCLGYRF